MECKGKLISAAKDWVSGKFRLTFEIEDDVSGQIDGIADKPLRIKAARWIEKRSLDSNAYYWVLLSKLAEGLHISKPRAHIMMLRRYGQNLLIDGKLKEMAQEYYDSHYGSREGFMREFGKNYL